MKEDLTSIDIRKSINPSFLSLIILIIFMCMSGYSIAADIGSVLDISPGDAAPWHIKAGNLTFDEKRGVFIATNGVTITQSGQVLSAREALYNEKTGIVEVTGNVRLEANEDVITGEKGVFNFNNNTGQITNGTLFLRQNHFFISGDSMEKIGDETYLLRNFHLTTCDGTRPAWSITGSEIRITIEGYGKIKNWAFRVRDIPILYIPYMIFPAKTERQTGLLPPRLGYSDRNGMDIEVPFFWAISDQTDATLYERFLSERGLMQGFEFRFVSEEDSSGLYLFDILRDEIEKKDLSNPDQIELSPYARTNRTRYWFRSRTEHNFPDNTQVRLDADVVSDQDYLKEFSGALFGYEARPDLAEGSGRPLEEINSPTRRSALRISRDREEYSLQASASYHQRTEGLIDDPTSQPLAGFHYSLLPRTISDLPFSFFLDSDYDYIWRDFGRKGHTVSIDPSISWPIHISRYLKFEPGLSATSTSQWFREDNGNSTHQSKNAYRLQGRLSTILERIYPFDWGKTTRLKHKLTPAITYQYRGYEDENDFRPWFEPIDARGKENLVTLSIDNLLDVKKETDKKISYSQWGSFSLKQGYNIDEATRDTEPQREKEPFEPLTGILTFKPSQAINIDMEGRWDHYSDSFSFYDTSFGLFVKRSGGRKDTYRVDYVFLDDENRGLNYYLNVNLSHGFAGGTSLNRDLDLKQNIGKSYWIEYLSQCWGIKIILEKLDEESNIQFTFRLLGLADLSGI